MKRKHSSDTKEFNPETLALGYGYEPERSEGAVKPPVFLTSTFQFSNADEGKRFFELAYGLREPDSDEEQGLIYSRINNPNLQIFEERMAAWDQTDGAATFASGMAAISTSTLALVKPGEVILSTAPVYGGTHYLFDKILPSHGIEVVFVAGGTNAPEAMRTAAMEIGPERVRMLYLETPSNPSNVHTDIAAISALASELSEGKERRTITAVDNTFLGPVFQRPAQFGADLVLYSATKFIGGHSDLIAGIASARADLLPSILEWRTMLGTVTTPFNGWLLLRSLETLSVRMRRQEKSAKKLAQLLTEHPRVTRVLYPGTLKMSDPQYAVWASQATGSGSLISFEVEGGEEAAFAVLNRFEVARLAVSLGGTESLVEHPMRMTHSDIDPKELEKYGVTPGLIRLSVGIEHLSDLKRDLLHALEF